ncbi:MAG: permease-like cell division protein FtsX [Panacagrimonas sp.]
MADFLARLFTEHARVCVGALGKQWRDPVGTLLTVLVIGVTLALPAGLDLLVDNLRNASGGLNETRSMTLFLRDELSATDGQKMRDELAADTGIADARYTSREQALEDFRERTDLGNVLDALPANPLPASITVTPAPQLDTPAVQQLAEGLKKLPGVELLRADAEWTERLSAALRLAERLALVLAVGLGLAAVLALGNTIRLDIEGRREEIQVLQLIGASPGFIRRPFLYAGFWYGLSGGIVAVAAVQLALWALEDRVSELVTLYQGAFVIAGLSFDKALVVMGSGAALGIVGAWLAAWRQSLVTSRI